MPLPPLNLLRASLLSPHPTPIYLHSTQLPTLDLPTHTHQIIDCVLSHSDRLLFSAITRCTITQSHLLLSHISAQDSFDNHILIFNRAERLVTPAFSSILVPLLYELPLLTGKKSLRVVLVSRTPYAPFRALISTHLQPLVIFIPPPNETELVKALTTAFQPSADSIPEEHHSKAIEYFPGYIKSLVNVLFPTTSNYSEIRRVALHIYPDYIAVLTSGKSATAAFNLVRGRLRGVLSNLYVHTVPTEQQIRSERHKRTAPNEMASLGFTASVLLIAAYLASHNPPTQDMRYFTIHQTKRPKTKRVVRRTGPPKPALSTNRPFVLDRLIAIFSAICPLPSDNITEISLSTTALIHISTLISLRYLSADPSPDPLSEPKYRCNLTLEHAQTLAQGINIQLHQYLHIS